MLVAVLQSVAMTVANPLHNRLHHDRFRRVAANYDNHLAPRANPTDPWVTVDASGVPVTVTPVLTTISGTPTIISGAPAELTATVLTLTSLGDVRTTTLLPTSSPTANGDGRGDARGGNSGGNAGDGSGSGVALPTAGSSSGTGSFPVCKNKDGPGAPFCLPGDRRLVVGAVYYGRFCCDFEAIWSE